MQQFLLTCNTETVRSHRGECVLQPRLVFLSDPVNRAQLLLWQPDVLDGLVEAGTFVVGLLDLLGHARILLGLLILFLLLLPLAFSLGLCLLSSLLGLQLLGCLDGCLLPGNSFLLGCLISQLLGSFTGGMGTLL